jgi:chemotaxis protein methyltransferase CheR
MTLHVARPQEYAFTERDFRMIAALAHEGFGLHLEQGKKPLVYARLARRVRALGLPGFADYCRLLQHPAQEEERQRMLGALTTNVTQFFREAHHFALLATLLRPLLGRARQGARIRLWSAGCSTGQEPYSIAATILDACPEADQLDIRVLASDVDADVLARAQAGRYGVDELAGLSPAHRTSLFGAGRQDGPIRPELRRLVTCRLLNLVSDWPMGGRFDAIFCRNVAIYFDQPTQQRLWVRFAERLPAGGMLFIGHSERVTGPAAAHLISAGVTTYSRRGEAPSESKEKPWD